MDKTSRNILLIFLFVLIFYLLSVLSSLLIPLVLALLLAVLFHPVVNLLHKKKVPGWLVLPIISGVTLIVIFIVVNIFIYTFKQVQSEQTYLLSQLYTKLNIFLVWFNNISGMELDTSEVLKSMKDIVDKQVVAKVAGAIAKNISSFGGSFFMFGLYFVVLLSGISEYRSYLKFVGGKKNEKGMVTRYETIRNSLSSYITIKLITSMATGLFATVICLSFGIKFAVFWGLLTFLLNFIPSIGSIIATVPPIVMGIIQFNSAGKVIFMLILLSLVQLVIGSVVEPKVMGNKLRLNTVTVIFGLVFWGYLWGISGMILSVPMLVILKLVLESTPSMHMFARVMGYPESKSV